MRLYILERSGPFPVVVPYRIKRAKGIPAQEVPDLGLLSDELRGDRLGKLRVRPVGILRILLSDFPDDCVDVVSFRRQHRPRVFRYRFPGCNAAHDRHRDGDRHDHGLRHAGGSSPASPATAIPRRRNR